MMNPRTVFFDIDDTLYNTTLQAEMARRNAIKVMIEAGLGISEDEGVCLLDGIVAERGSNDPAHFDALLGRCGIGKNPRIIAAGIVAYHTTKTAYLTPYADTIPTLLELRDRGYTLGVVTEGRSVKQWEKIIRLGLQHFFHTVVISEDVGLQKVDSGMFVEAARRAGCDPHDAFMVGDRLDRDMKGAKAAGMSTIQLMKGKHAGKMPSCVMEEPDYVIEDLRGILRILS